MFEIEITFGNAVCIEHEVFEDSLPWTIITEWQFLTELVIYQDSGRWMVLVPVSDQLRRELEEGEAFVMANAVLPIHCEGQRRLLPLSSSNFLALEVRAPEIPNYRPGLYRFSISMDRVETGKRAEDDSTIRFRPWLDRILFQSL